MSAVKKLRDWFASKFHRCEKCGSYNTVYSSYNWARGWNELCSQAYGDAGAYCKDCSHVTFDDTLEEHLKKIPNWCKPVR